MVRAVLKKGRIQPLDALPDSWADGQELIIEEVGEMADPRDIGAWSKEIGEAAAQIPDEEHERLLRALEEQKAESKGQTKGVRGSEAGVMAEMAAWRGVYSGLSEEEIADVEAIALDRSHFFRKEPG